MKKFWKKQPIYEDPDEESRLGVILLKMGAINEAQLAAALSIHRKSGQQIGDAIRHIAYVHSDEVKEALWIQEQLRGREPSAGWDRLLQVRNKCSKNRAERVQSLLTELELSHVA